MRTERFPCGCRYTDEPPRWIEQCAPHKAEHDELHQRHLSDLAELRQSVPTFLERQP